MRAIYIFSEFVFVPTENSNQPSNKYTARLRGLIWYSVAEKRKNKGNSFSDQREINDISSSTIPNFRKGNY
jgi:hypothetical protein